MDNSSPASTSSSSASTCSSVSPSELPKISSPNFCSFLHNSQNKQVFLDSFYKSLKELSKFDVDATVLCNVQQMFGIVMGHRSHYRENNIKACKRLEESEKDFKSFKAKTEQILKSMKAENDQLSKLLQESKDKISAYESEVIDLEASVYREKRNYQNEKDCHASNIASMKNGFKKDIDELYELRETSQKASEEIQENLQLIQSLKTQCEKLESKFETAESDAKNWSEKAAKLEKENLENEETIAAQNAEISSLKELIELNNSEISSKTFEIDQLKENIQIFKKASSDDKNSLEALIIQGRKYQEEIGVKNSQISKMSQMLEENKNTMNEMAAAIAAHSKASLAAKQVEAKLEKMNKNEKKLKTDLKFAKNEVEQLKAAREMASKNLSSTADEIIRKRPRSWNDAVPQPFPQQQQYLNFPQSFNPNFPSTTSFTPHPQHQQPQNYPITSMPFQQVSPAHFQQMQSQLFHQHQQQQQRQQQHLNGMPLLMNSNRQQYMNQQQQNSFSPPSLNPNFS